MAVRIAWIILLISTKFCRCQDDYDSFVWGSNDNIKFGKAQPILEESPLEVDLTPKISNRYQTIDGRNIFVFDDLFKPVMLQTFSNYLNTDLGAWQFNLHEPYDGGIEKPTDNVPWINQVDCLEFLRSLTGRIMQKAVMDAAGTKDLYYPYKARAKLVRRGDYTKLHTDASKTEHEYSAMLFLNPKWRKNDYGELYLFDEDNEIIAGAVPKYGRVVVWQSSLSYLPRPPSMNFKKGQLLLHVQFTKSKDKVLSCHAEKTAEKKEREAVYAAGFVGSDKPPSLNIDVAQHKVSEHSSVEGKKIFVLDDLFYKEDLDKLRAFIFKHGTYYYDDTDVGLDEDNDNVQWIAGFEIDDYIQSRLWNTMQQGLKYVSGGKDKWFPYDISCNLIRSADHTRIHRDCEHHEDEWTFLIYLTPNWTKNDYGETAFYETSTDDTEIITEVRPKYGRAVIFQGIIPHSARPPSSRQSQARLTFVAKVSVNEIVGRRKAFAEEMRHYQGVVEQLKVLDLLEQGIEPSIKHFRPEEPDGEDDERKEDHDEEGEEDNEREGRVDEENEREGRVGEENERDGRVGEERDAAADEDEEEEDSLYGGNNEDNDDHIDDPRVEELMMKFEETSQTQSLEKVRHLHRELHARHVVDRQNVLERISKLI